MGASGHVFISTVTQVNYNSTLWKPSKYITRVVALLVKCSRLDALHFDEDIRKFICHIIEHPKLAHIQTLPISYSFLDLVYNAETKQYSYIEKA